MMNTNQTPNGGWQYYQSQTGWHAPFPVGHTFTQQVQNIIKHRQANPAIVAKHRLATDPANVGQELIAFQQARGALPPSPKMTAPAASPSLPHLSGLVVAGIEVVKRMAAGMATLLEWDAAGMPHVEQVEADARAHTCAACPRNDRTKSLRERFTEQVAAKFHARFERMNQLNLRTPDDDKLMVCQSCLCPLRDKVWMPKELVLKRLKPEQKAELHESCWILKL